MRCKIVDELYTLKERSFLLQRVAACFLLSAAVFDITETGNKHQASSLATETRGNMKEHRATTRNFFMQLE